MKNTLTIGQKLYMHVIYEGILGFTELIVVGYDEQLQVTVACDNEGDRYDIKENDRGDLYVTDEYISLGNVVTTEPTKGLLNQKEHYLDGTLVDNFEECECDEMMEIFDPETFINILMLNEVFSSENFGESK